ncbi:hypothetical protein B5X24_HaOG206297 [Helicoverpa armigera]|nr:hypothetical protein B5X24_HaOG206297 [Helicoverpa armigera]
MVVNLGFANQNVTLSDLSLRPAPSWSCRYVPTKMAPPEMWHPGRTAPSAPPPLTPLLVLETFKSQKSPICLKQAW